MREIDSLYNLVKSLTKSEKAYFKKYARRHVIRGQNKYTLLFDAIDSSSNGYNEKQIKLKFQNEKFVKNFPVMKKYLMETLLKSLSSFYSMKSPDNEIKNEISYIEILYKKVLFQSCAKILNRLLKQAYKRDNFLVILELLKWKKNLIHEGAFRGNDFVNLEKAYNEEQGIIAKIKNLSDYRMLSYRARSLLVGTYPHNSAGDIKRELHKILNNPLLKSEQRALSYPAAMTYFHILANIYDNLRKDYEAFECRKRLIKLMEDHPEALRENLTNYVVSIYNILGSCLTLKFYAELEHYIGKLRELEKTYTKKISDNDRLLTSLGSSIYELRMRINKGEFSTGVQNLAEIERGLEKFDKKLVRTDEFYLYYLIAYGYYGAGKFNEALKWINRILNDKDTDRNSKLYIKSRILNLIIHFELGNFDLLDYLTRSTYRFIKNSGSAGREDKLIVQLFKGLLDISTRAQLKAFFEGYLKLVKTGHQSRQIKSKEAGLLKPFETQTNFTNVAEFDLVSWLECKISGKKFADIIKEKHTRQS